MKYRCTVCGYIYDEEKEGTKFADLPEDWTCPLCGVGKEMFEKVEDNIQYIKIGLHLKISSPISYLLHHLFYLFSFYVLLEQQYVQVFHQKI